MKRLQQLSMLLPLILAVLLSIFFVPSVIWAQSSPQDIQNNIDLYNKKLLDLSKAKNTLANQINLLSTQISVTTLKINQTENTISTLQDEISQLDHQIIHLDISLNQTAKIFASRVAQNYKIPRVSSFLLLFTSHDFNHFSQMIRLTHQLQLQDHDLLFALETTRSQADIQKQKKLQSQLELQTQQDQLKSQKDTLDQQKKVKDNLLLLTRNDESKYQQLLAQARSELAAIQSILAGGGQETKVGLVSVGTKIGTLIQGPSCSSSGTHLHFTVESTDGTVQNPFSYLKNVAYTDYSSGDAFNPSGSWEWPLNPPIDFNQGYGKTWSTTHTWVSSIYTFHNGIDIVSDDPSVLSTQNGTLYRGKIAILSENCSLQYVKVIDSQAKLITLYLHLNYY